MADPGALAAVASIIAAFGVAMLFFRIQRELQMQEEHEINWIPWADWLLVGATILSLFLVILPMLVLRGPASRWALLPPSAAASAAILVAGYMPAILAHYRFILGGRRQGPRINPEPAERLVVVLASVVAVAAGIGVFILRSR